MRRVDGTIDEVGTEIAGFPLNVSPDPHYRYKVASLSMEPGSVLVAYTDGITDTRSRDGEWYGVARADDRKAQGGRRFTTSDLEVLVSVALKNQNVGSLRGGRSE